MLIAGFEVEIVRSPETSRASHAGRSSPARGRVIVLLHGFTGSAASWREVIARLPEKRTVVSVNLPGHHPSTAIDPRGGFSGTADAIARLVRALEGAAGAVRGRTHLAGYSLGGRLAIATLTRHPDLFERATLIGVSAGLDAAELRSQRVESDRAWIELLEKEGTKAFVAAWERQPILRHRAGVPRERIDAERAIRMAHDPQGLARVLEYLGLGQMPSYWGALRKLSMPVRFVAGAEDAKFVALATKMSALVPRSELAVVYESGHNALVDRPEAIANLLAGPP